MANTLLQLEKVSFHEFIIYLAMHKNSLKVIGVDNPCLFNAFAEKHIDYKEV